MALAALALAAPAAAKTEDLIAPSDAAHPAVDSGWQAGTCNAEPPEAGAETCSVATPSQFFEQAAGHPNWGFTQFIVRHEEPGETPVGELETVRVDLPVGFSVNPGATEQCPLAVFEAGAEGCPPGSKVGVSKVTVALLGIPSEPKAPLTEVPVYNVVPKQGESARFGLELGGNEVFLEGDVAWWGDYHEGFTIHVPRAAELEPLIKGLVLKNRLVFNGRSGDGTFLTTPSTCLGEAYPWGPSGPEGASGHTYSTWLLAGSYQEESEPGYVFPQSAEPPLESPIPPGTSPKECGTIPYGPSIHVEPGTNLIDSPAPATVSIAIPHLLPAYAAPGSKEGERVQDTSPTKAAQLTLPQGIGLNPAAANGLKTCSDAEFGKGTTQPVACPAASRVGTAQVESPALPEGSLEGPIYAGEQLSRDPASGKEYRIFIDASSARYGIDARLIGNVSADPRTGQLTTTLANDPQVPVTNFVTSFFGGPHAVLSSPLYCAQYTAGAVLTPWSGNAAATPSSNKFGPTSPPGGGGCPKRMADRAFHPGFAAAPASNKAGAFSPVTIRFTRNDGEQELKRVETLLAPGMTGKLAGIPYCPEAAIAAAGSRSGREEAAAPSCPAASQVGTATVLTGTGSDPYRVEGKAYLAGPYEGAPLSLVVITPATAGPYDLGTVVERVAMFVDPETAQIRAASDPMPHVFGGTPLGIREIDLRIDRPSFTLNPTSCEPLVTSATISGGGADPENPAAFSLFPASVPFQTSECEALGFRPKLYLRFSGRRAVRRLAHPKLRAVLMAREGDANIRRAAVTLPHSELLDQGHIGTVCTRVELAASACPGASVYGYAWAKSPLLEQPLAGPVYLVSSEHELPDLLADLHGQVDVRLRGVISATKGRMKSVFSSLPDVPVSEFVLTMKGGAKGLLQNSRPLCGRRNSAFLNFEGQNGKRMKVKRLHIKVSGCRRHPRRHAGRRHHGRR